MIQGRTGANRTAAVRIQVRGLNDVREDLTAVIDTGFSGFLSLPGERVDRLGLATVGTRRARLADGTQVVSMIYVCEVYWHGRFREVATVRLGREPLVGMSLIWGSELRIRAEAGGEAEIEELASDSAT